MADVDARDGHPQRSDPRVADRPTAMPGTDAHRRQITHDIEHELSTIATLASAVSTAQDVGDDSRARATQILEETRWLSGLVHVYEDERNPESSAAGVALTRLDLLATDIMRPVRMSSRAQIVLQASAVSARVDRLEFWRALRNIVLNALAAAGEAGCLLVRVGSADGTAVIEVEDDGPGFDPAGAGRSSLGLSIINAWAVTCGGRVTFERGNAGGCLVRLELPEAS
jgi:signal transduction histidine kinase